MENIRDFLTFLKDRGELATVEAEVSSELEITEITERTIRSKGPALLFKNVSPFHSFPASVYGPRPCGLDR